MPSQTVQSLMIEGIPPPVNRPTLQDLITTTEADVVYLRHLFLQAERRADPMTKYWAVRLKGTEKHLRGLLRVQEARST